MGQSIEPIRGVRYNDGMEMLMIIIFAIFVVALILAGSAWPDIPPVSQYELERRRQQNNRTAIHQLRRIAVYDDLVSLQRCVVALLLVLMVMASIGAFDFGGGVLVALAVALLHGGVGRIGWVHAIAQRFYNAVEPSFVSFAGRFPRVVRIVRSFVPPVETNLRLGSRAELEHLVRHARPSVLPPVEREQALGSLTFARKTVEAVMVPRNAIKTVEQDAMVGPLLLDELHRTGHSRFPVVDGDIDHIIGVLHTRDFMSLKEAVSAQVQTVMDPNVYYIDGAQSLEQALGAFIKTRQQVFIVVNTYRETVGMVTLDDCIEALLGHAPAADDDEVYSQPVGLPEPTQPRALPMGEQNDA